MLYLSLHFISFHFIPVFLIFFSCLICSHSQFFRHFPRSFFSLSMCVQFFVNLFDVELCLHFPSTTFSHFIVQIKRKPFRCCGIPDVAVLCCVCCCPPLPPPPPPSSPIFSICFHLIFFIYFPYMPCLRVRSLFPILISRLSFPFQRFYHSAGIVYCLTQFEEGKKTFFAFLF